MNIVKKSMILVMLWCCVFVWMSCTPVTPPVTRENFGEFAFDRMCKWVHQTCCQGKTLIKDAQALYGTDIATCKANYSKSITLGGFPINFKQIFDSLANNENIDFDAAQASLCLDALESQSCTGSDASGALLSGICGKVYVGKKAAGAACTDASECAPGHTCPGIGDKKCVALGKEGAACDPISSPCDSSAELSCDFQSKTCIKKKAVGEACQTGECASGLDCNSGKCVAKPASSGSVCP